MKKITSLETKLRIAMDALEAEFDFIYSEDNKEKFLTIADYFRNIHFEDEEKEKALDKALLTEEGLQKDAKEEYKKLLILIMASDAYEYYSYLKLQGILLSDRQEKVLEFLSMENITPNLVIKMYKTSDDFAIDLYDNYTIYELHNEIFLRHVVEEICGAGKHHHVFKMNPLAILNYGVFLSNYEENFKTQTLIEIFETFYQGLSDIKEGFKGKYNEDDIDSAIYNAAIFLECETEELEYRDENGECLYEDITYSPVQYADDDLDDSAYSELEDIDPEEMRQFAELEDALEPLMEELRLTIIDNLLTKASTTDPLYAKKMISLIIKEAYKYLRFNKMDPNYVPLDYEEDLVSFIESDSTSVDDLIKTFATDKDFALKMLFYYIKMKEGNDFAIPEPEDYDDTLKQFYNSKPLIKINKYISKGYIN